MNISKLAWRNIWHKPLNTVLSIILVAFGVGLLSIIINFQKQFQNEFEKNQAGIDMVIGAKGSPLQLILSSMFHVDSPTGNITIEDGQFLFNPKHPLIDLSVPLSIGDSYQSFRILGTNKDIFTLYPAEIKEGNLWEHDMEVVVGASVAQQLQMKLGDTFYSSHGFNQGDLEHDEGDPFTVVGILKEHGSVIDQLILCNTKDIWAVHDHDHVHESEDSLSHNHGHQEHEKFNLLDYPEQEITSVLVRLKPNMKKSVTAINMPRSINENTSMMAASPTYQLNKLIAQVGTGLKSLQYLALLIALVSGVSIFISMFSSLKDRKNELAIMRVGGAKPRQLMYMLLLEAMFLTLVGAIIGFILSRIGLFFLHVAINDQFKYSLNQLIIYQEEIFILVGVLLLGIAAAFIPAYLARSENIEINNS